MWLIVTCIGKRIGKFLIRVPITIFKGHMNISSIDGTESLLNYLWNHEISPFRNSNNSLQNLLKSRRDKMPKHLKRRNHCVNLISLLKSCNAYSLSLDGRLLIRVNEKKYRVLSFTCGHFYIYFLYIYFTSGLFWCSKVNVQVYLNICNIWQKKCFVHQLFLL